MKITAASLLHKAVFFVVLILLPVVITFAYSHNNNKKHLKEEILEDLTVLAEAYEGQVYQFLEMSRRRVQDFSSDGAIRDMASRIASGDRKVSGALGAYMEKNKRPLDRSITRIGIISSEGRIIASTDGKFTGKDVSGEEFFIKGRLGVMVSERGKGPEGVPELAVSAPLTDRFTGKPVGVITNFIHLSDLNKVLTGEFSRKLGAVSWSKGRRKTMEAYLVNRDALMITDSIFIKDAVLRQSVGSPPVETCLKSNTEMSGFYRDYRGVEVAGASMCLPALKWVLLTEIDSDEVLAPISFMLREALIGGAVVAGLIGLLFAAFYRVIILRVGRLSQASESLAAGNYDVTVPVESGDEIGRLSGAFNRMSHEIKDRTRLLKESEERLRAIIDNSTAVVFMKDTEGRYLLINRRFEKLLKITREEIKGKTDEDLFTADAASALRENDRKVLEAKAPLIFDETVPFEDGLRFYISVKFPLFDSSGNIFAICGMATDITERRRVEESLKQSEEKYRTLVANIPDVTWSADAKGRVVFISPNIKEVCGYAPEEVYGDPNIWLESIHPEDAERIGSAYSSLFREKKKFDEEYRIRRKDGRWIWVYDRATFTYEKDGEQYADGVLLDITGRKLAEEKIERLNRLYSVLSRVNEAIVRIRDIGKLYEEVCRITVEEGRFQSAWIGTLDSASLTIKPVAAHGCCGEYIQADDVKDKPYARSSAVRDGRLTVCNDIETDTRMKRWRDNVLKCGLRSYASMPIYMAGNPVGSINLYSGEADFFKEDVIRLLEAMSADVSFAVESIETERQRKRSDEELKLMQTLTIAIKEAEDVTSALKVAITKVCEATGWTLGEVWLPNKDRTALEHAGAWSGGEITKRFIEESGKFVFQKGLGVPGAVWASKRPVWVKDVSIDGRDFPRAAIAREAGLTSAFGIPIIAGGTVLAVLEFFMREPREEDKRYADLVAAVSAQLGIVIQRRLAEEERKEARQRYEELVNNLTVGVYRTTEGPEGRFIEANRALVEMLGAGSREELLSRKVSDLYADKHRRAEVGTKLIKQGYLMDEEVELTTLKGKKIWASLTAVMKEGASGATYFDGIMEDITEKKKLEELYRQSQKMEAVGQLAGGVAHDFNNILTALIGYGNLLIMKKGDDETVRNYADHMLSLSEKAATLTQALLAFSRKQIITPQPVDLNDLIRRVEKILTRLIGEDIELKTVYHGNNLVIRADSTQIEHVLMNLATNARDAMPRGGILIISTDLAEIGTSFIEAHGYGESGIYGRISFSDSGVGMDNETLKRIFEPFFTTKEVGKGTGLGLSMVYGIIKQHNGFIDVNSEPGKGTTFKIYLPLAKPEAKEAPGEKAVVRGGTETILLAEDEEEVRSITKTMLEEFGYRVIEAFNGEEAVRRYMENKGSVDLLVFDIVMPKKSGEEAYDEIKNADPEVKVLFTSGYASDIIKTRGIIGDMSFISKPVSPSEFLKKVREVLDR